MIDSGTMKLRGQSPEFLRVVHAARIIATTDTTVLITGEQGVGKEMLAREIHRSSRHRGQPFENIFCAGLKNEALSAVLTAGGDDHRSVSGGTVYFSEISDLSAEGQALLLNLIEGLAVRPRGCPDLRLIASSSRDLHALVEQGLFREDLYFRLYVVPLEVPALSARDGDIALLLKQFTADMSRRHGRKTPVYSVTSRNLLKAYRWPGNVRELKNFCERMVILFAGTTVQPDSLPIEIRRGAGSQRRAVDFLLPEQGIDLSSFEADIIGQALRMTGGNRSKAARLLGLTRDTLLYRIQKHAIKV